SGAELVKLAGLYDPGKRVWRMPHTHFSMLDYNMPLLFPAGARPPHGGARPPDANPECQAQQPGSIIKCQSQILGEALEPVGTEHQLRYQSNRVPGRRAAYAYDIRLSGDAIPDTVREIRLEVYVAGRRYFYTFDPAPNRTFTFEWDGEDAYGRRVQGRQPITVRIGFTYDMHYGFPRGLRGERGGSFGAPGDASTFAAVARARQEGTKWVEFTGAIGTLEVSALGLGGWGLDQLHVFSPIDHTLYLGDGRRIDRSDVVGVVEHTAGKGCDESVWAIDEGPALERCVTPSAIAAGHAGEVYFIEAGNKVGVVTAEGMIREYADVPARLEEIRVGQDGRL
ncbi:MAG: hypothetical protein GWO02_19575, partial [Gammaproteobacteria bacterium]|nr:hypothetical protein [Gammaproteobacteria bacterium]